MLQTSAQQRKLQKLLRRPDVWRGESSRFARQPVVDTGHTELNRLLIKQGWPLQGVIEWLQPQPGQGEWQLLAPGLRALLSKQAGYLVLINPPALLHGPGMQQLDIDHKRLLIIEPRNRADFLFSVLAAASSQGSLAILCWESESLLYKEMRKLQLCAANSHGLFVLFRGIDKVHQSSPARLKLSTSIEAQGFEVYIHKQRGTFQSSLQQHHVHIALPAPWRALPALSSPLWLQPEQPEQNSNLPVAAGTNVHPFQRGLN